MTKQLQKAILKHLESEVRKYRILVFNIELRIKEIDKCIEGEWKDCLNANNRFLKQSEKNLAEFKKLYPLSDTPM